MGFLQGIIVYIESVSTKVPLEIFTFLGALSEEIIAPIPSPLVMTLAGSIASSQNKTFLFLLWLAFIGSVGKTIGAYVIYIITDKAEDFIVGKLGKILGVTHNEIERLGKQFDGTGRDYIFLFLLRFVPIVPTSPISIICGIIKIDLKKYLITSFSGYFLRNMIYLYLGYIGYSSISQGFDSAESIIKLLLALLIGSVIVYLYFRRNKIDAVSVIKNKLGPKN